MKPAKSAIKYVNMPNPEPSHTASKTHTKHKPDSSGLTKGKQAKPDLVEVKEAYEQGRKAFQELAALHADTQAEADGALRRLDRLEQELRREREQNARYSTQIVSQEQEIRRTKEAKRAVDDLNSRLNTRLSATAKSASEPSGLRGEHDKLKSQHDKLKSQHDHLKSQHDHLKSQHDQLKNERDQLKTSKDNAKSERDQLRQRERSYSDMVEHAERALGICARVCATHAPEISRDIQDTQKTLRDFQESMQA